MNYVEDVIRILLIKANIGKCYSSLEESRKNEVFELYGDISKIKQILNWQPQTIIEEGLSHFVQFYKNQNI